MDILSRRKRPRPYTNVRYRPVGGVQGKRGRGEVVRSRRMESGGQQDQR